MINHFLAKNLGFLLSFCPQELDFRDKNLFVESELNKFDKFLKLYMAVISQKTKQINIKPNQNEQKTDNS